MNVVTDQTVLRRSVKLALEPLPRSVKIKIGLAGLASAAASVLDMLGVLLLSAVGVVIVAAVAPSTTETLADVPTWLPLGDYPPIWSAAALALAATIILGLKSVTTWLINRNLLFQLASVEAIIGRRLVTRYFTAPFTGTHHLTSQAVVNGIVIGSRAMSNLIGNCILLITEVTLIISLSILLAIASPLLFIFAVAYFGIVTIVISGSVGKRGRLVSAEGSSLTLATSSAVHQGVGLAREIRIYDLSDRFAERIESIQNSAATANARAVALSSAPRYVLEASLILAIVLAGAIVLSTQPPERAAFSLGLFLISSTRLLPSFMRASASWSSIQTTLGQMNLAQPLMALSTSGEGNASTLEANQRSMETARTLNLVGVDLNYPESERAALKNVTVRIDLPTRIALVGPSGGGKSSLADIIAGVVEPTAGNVEFLDGDRIACGRPSTAFVAQDPFIAPWTVRDNVTLVMPGEIVDEEEVWQALEQARVADVIESLPQGLDTNLGERGLRLSGGQRQRIALARALYRKPSLLILDEATSALDSSTELAVAEALQALPSEITVVTVAHRLATIRSYDWVWFIEAGRLVDCGTFGDVASRQELLESAAVLQGLSTTQDGGPTKGG